MIRFVLSRTTTGRLPPRLRGSPRGHGDARYASYPPDPHPQEPAIPCRREGHCHPSSIASTATPRQARASGSLPVVRARRQPSRRPIALRSAMVRYLCTLFGQAASSDASEVCIQSPAISTHDWSSTLEKAQRSKEVPAKSAPLRLGRVIVYLVGFRPPRHARVRHRSRGYAQPWQDPPLQDDPPAQDAEYGEHVSFPSLRLFTSTLHFEAAASRAANARRRRSSASLATSCSAGLAPTIPSATSGAMAATTLCSLAVS